MNDAWHVKSERSIDIICMGPVAVDLYSEQMGSSLEDAETFRKHLGGYAGNIAVGSSRLGLNSSLFSCIGTDAMGQFLKAELQKEKVDISHLKETNKHLTGLVILGINPPDRFPLIFYRENCADMQLKKHYIDGDYFSDAKALLITGTGLSSENIRSVSHDAVDTARYVNTRIIFDLDYKSVLWGLADQNEGDSRYKTSQMVTQQYQMMLPKSDLIVGTEDEILIAGNSSSIDAALKTIRVFTKAPIVLKRGAEGAHIYFDDMSKPIISKPYPVKVINALGAGDAFMSGFVRGLLRGESWETCAKYGNASRAIIVTRHGCAPAMPTFDEIDHIIKQAFSQEKPEHVYS